MYSNTYYNDAFGILDKLYQFDYECLTAGVKGELYVLGGSGIMLLMQIVNNEQFRPTRDIDVNILSASEMSEFRALLLKNEIDIVGGIAFLPPAEDFRDRENLHHISAEFEAINVYVPNIEMLACTKLFTNREKDFNDLMYTNILNLCDKEKLLEMVEEYRSYMLNADDSSVNVNDLLHFFEARGI